MLKKVVLVSFNPSDYKAVVRPYGSISAYLYSIAVSRAIPQGEMVAGRHCVMVVFDETNPADGVIVAVFTP